MYKEYLAEFWYIAKALENSKVSFLTPTGGIYGEVGVNTFRNAIDAHYLPHSSEYVAPPSIDIVRPWFETIRYKEVIPAKGTLKKSLLPPSLANGINIDYASIFWEDIIIKLNKRHKEKVVAYTRFLSLLMMHKMKEGYRDGEVTPYPTQVFTEPVVFKAPKPSSNAERVPQGTKPGAKPGHKKHSTSSKQPFVSSKEATKGGSSKAPTGSKTSHLKRKKESSSAMDSNPSQTSASTPVVAEMHKEDQQATGGPTSLGVTSEARANPQLSSGPGPHVLADKTKSVSEGLETVLTQPIIGKGARFITIQVEEDEASRTINDADEEANEVHASTNVETEDTLVSKSPKSSQIQELTNQLNELLVKSLQTEFSKILSVHDFSSLLSTKLKDLPSKFNKLTEEVKGLKKQVHELEIELLGDWKEIPSKLEDFTKTVTIEMVQAKLKTLDALPSLLNKVTNALNQFAQAIASKKTGDTSVPSAGQAGTQPAEGEKNTNQATIS
ncbi:hypothetical protein Tco_0640511 [Tanacetum coccineum]